MSLSNEQLDLLRRCHLAVSGQREGTGFFIAPGLLVTCAHVVGFGAGASVRTVEEPDRSYPADVVALLAYRGAWSELHHMPDMAVLQIDGDTFGSRPWVKIGYETPPPGDPAYSVGAPPSAGAVTLVDSALWFEGHFSHGGDVLFRFREGQVQPGMSGGAVVSATTGRVHAMISATRGESSFLGGLALPMRLLRDELPLLFEQIDRQEASNEEWDQVFGTRVRGPVAEARVPSPPPSDPAVRGEAVPGSAVAWARESTLPPRSRVVAGGQGGGKTFQLQVYQQLAERPDAVSLPPIAEVPDSVHVLEVCDRIRQAGLLEEWWTELWRRVVLCFAASSLLTSERATQALPAKARSELRSALEALPIERPKRRSHQPVTNLPIILSALIRHRLDHPEADQRLAHEMGEIEALLGESTLPVYVFIDSDDSVLSNAPFARLYCDRGMARAIVAFRHGGNGSSRLTVCGSVQLAAVAKDIESWPGHPSGLLLLTWTPDEALKLLSSHFSKAWGDAPADQVLAWMREALITNTVRNCSENLADYLVRHTRYLPRDIVHLAGRLAGPLRAFWADESAGFPTDVVYDAVEEIASLAARQELRAIGVEVAVLHGPPAVGNEVPDLDTIDIRLDELLRAHIKNESLAPDAMHQLDADFHRTFPTVAPARLSDLLWQHRLVAARVPNSMLPHQFARPTGRSQYPFDSECLASTILTNVLDLKTRPRRTPIVPR